MKLLDAIKTRPDGREVAIVDMQTGNTVYVKKDGSMSNVSASFFEGDTWEYESDVNSDRNFAHNLYTNFVEKNYYSTSTRLRFDQTPYGPVWSFDVSPPNDYKFEVVIRGKR